jgi:hypothetical protein
VINYELYYKQLIQEGLTAFNPAITHTIGGTQK